MKNYHDFDFCHNCGDHATIEKRGLLILEQKSTRHPNESPGRAALTFLNAGSARKMLWRGHGVTYDHRTCRNRRRSKVQLRRMACSCGPALVNDREAIDSGWHPPKRGTGCVALGRTMFPSLGMPRVRLHARGLRIGTACVLAMRPSAILLCCAHSRRAVRAGFDGVNG